VKKCGDCQACCVVFSVAEIINKPKWTPCVHQCKTGCAIYPQRPKACRDFVCYFLQDPQGYVDKETGKRFRFGRDDRPDRLGVIFSSQMVSGQRVIVAHETYPGASRKPRAKHVIRVLAGHCPVLVHNERGGSTIVGETADLTRVGGAIHTDHPAAGLTEHREW